MKSCFSLTWWNERLWSHHVSPPTPLDWRLLCEPFKRASRVWVRDLLLRESSIFSLTVESFSRVFSSSLQKSNLLIWFLNLSQWCVIFSDFPWVESVLVWTIVYGWRENLNSWYIGFVWVPNPICNLPWGLICITTVVITLVWGTDLRILTCGQFPFICSNKS
jgi:hypothetical protein